MGESTWIMILKKAKDITASARKLLCETMSFAKGNGTAFRVNDLQFKMRRHVNNLEIWMKDKVPIPIVSDYITNGMKIINSTIIFDINISSVRWVSEVLVHMYYQTICVPDPELKKYPTDNICAFDRWWNRILIDVYGEKCDCNIQDTIAKYSPTNINNLEEGRMVNIYVNKFQQEITDYINRSGIPIHGSPDACYVRLIQLAKKHIEFEDSPKSIRWVSENLNELSFIARDLYAHLYGNVNKPADMLTQVDLFIDSWEKILMMRYNKPILNIYSDMNIPPPLRIPIAQSKLIIGSSDNCLDDEKEMGGSNPTDTKPHKTMDELKEIYTALLTVMDDHLKEKAMFMMMLPNSVGADIKGGKDIRRNNSFIHNTFNAGVPKVIDSTDMVETLQIFEDETLVVFTNVIGCYYVSLFKDRLDNIISTLNELYVGSKYLEDNKLDHIRIPSKTYIGFLIGLVEYSAAKESMLMLHSGAIKDMDDIRHNDSVFRSIRNMATVSVPGDTLMVVRHKILNALLVDECERIQRNILVPTVLAPIYDKIQKLLIMMAEFIQESDSEKEQPAESTNRSQESPNTHLTDALHIAAHNYAVFGNVKKDYRGFIKTDEPGITPDPTFKYFSIPLHSHFGPSRNRIIYTGEFGIQPNRYTPYNLMDALIRANSTATNPPNDEKEQPMSEPQSFSTTKSVTLPKDSILEYLGSEVVTGFDLDSRGNINKDTIRTERTKTGLLLAWPDEARKCIMVGFSRCNPKDKYDMYDACTVAMENAEKIMQRSIPIPENIRSHWSTFVSRCCTYYKQLATPDWGMSWTMRDPNANKSDVKLKDVAPGIFSPVHAIVEMITLAADEHNKSDTLQSSDCATCNIKDTCPDSLVKDKDRVLFTTPDGFEIKAHGKVVFKLDGSDVAIAGIPDKCIGGFPAFARTMDISTFLNRHRPGLLRGVNSCDTCPFKDSCSNERLLKSLK